MQRENREKRVKRQTSRTEQIKNEIHSYEDKEETSCRDVWRMEKILWCSSAREREDSCSPSDTKRTRGARPPLRFGCTYTSS